MFKMIIRILLLLGAVASAMTLDPNYPIFNGDEGLTTEKLNKILSLSEQQLKRIEAIDYK